MNPTTRQKYALMARLSDALEREAVAEQRSTRAHAVTEKARETLSRVDDENAPRALNAFDIARAEGVAARRDHSETVRVLRRCAEDLLDHVAPK